MFSSIADQIQPPEVSPPGTALHSILENRRIELENQILQQQIDAERLKTIRLEHAKQSIQEQLDELWNRVAELEKGVKRKIASKPKKTGDK